MTEFEDLQAHLDGHINGRLVSQADRDAAAMRLDRRSVARSQMSREAFRQTWGVSPEDVPIPEEHS
jgi:hypothetical protein